MRTPRILQTTYQLYIREIFAWEIYMYYVPKTFLLTVYSYHQMNDKKPHIFTLKRGTKTSAVDRNDETHDEDIAIYKYFAMFISIDMLSNQQTSTSREFHFLWLVIYDILVAYIIITSSGAYILKVY